MGLQIDFDQDAHIAVPTTSVATPSITFSFLALGTAIRRDQSAPKSDIASVLNLP